MQVDERFRIHEHAHISELEYPVALARLRVEADVVAQSGASSALHSQPQSALLGRDALLDDGRANPGQSLIGYLDALRGRGLRSCSVPQLES